MSLLLAAPKKIHIISINGVMKVDKRNYDRDMISKMYDIIELIYILNRLTNEFYEEDYSKQYLLDMMDNMQNVKYSYDKYKRRDEKINAINSDSYQYGKKDSFIDRIIFYLKSLNGE